MIKAAAEQGITVPQLAEKYINAFMEDTAAINIEPATLHPRATENITEIIKFVQGLVEKGYFELRQGLIYGPFIPVYGIGGIVYYLYFRFAKPKDKLEVFFLSMILRWNYRISSFLYPRSSFWNDFMGLFLFKI